MRTGELQPGYKAAPWLKGRTSTALFFPTAPGLSEGDGYRVPSPLQGTDVLKPLRRGVTMHNTSCGTGLGGMLSASGVGQLMWINHQKGEELCQGSEQKNQTSPSEKPAKYSLWAHALEGEMGREVPSPATLGQARSARRSILSPPSSGTDAQGRNRRTKLPLLSPPKPAQCKLCPNYWAPTAPYKLWICHCLFPQEVLGNLCSVSAAALLLT